MGGVRVSCVSIVGVFSTGGVLFGRNDIDFGTCDAAACHLAHFKACPDIERGGCFCKGVEGNTGIDQGAEHHVATYTGKTF